MNTKPVRIIQVGVGGFGAVWLDVIRQSADVEMVGLVDINRETAMQACRKHGWSEAIFFPTLVEALRSARADAAVVVTPPAAHREPVVAALEAGLDVISEKPMAETLTDCKAMVRAAQRTGRMYVVSQNYRYQPAMWTLANVVRSGRLGRVGEVKLDFYLGMWFEGFRQQMEYPLVVDMAIHHFDLIRFILGTDAVAVTAAGWNPPWSHYRHDCSCAALFEMASGARVIYNGSWCAKGQFCDWNGNWQIGCERGTVLYQNGVITIHHAPERYEVTSTENVIVRPPPLEGQRYVLADFLRARANGHRAGTDCFDNIHSVAMVFATVEAMRTGRRVEVGDAETRQWSTGQEVRRWNESG
ncbi:MAG: Gfo/Idh/MocA family oxidoreductase [Verrucomicrobiae bacterium]|nr:Gfo/Idh/MocA family oxidoreductase [Verrucomicrobiae bacterium]MDW8343376.1 Gfo/Idh/MocA family oxidoreductase [Verrucomicrobiae bacterium]